MHAYLAVRRFAACCPCHAADGNGVLLQKTVTVPRKRNHGGHKVRIRVMGGGVARVVKSPRPATFLSAADLTVKRQKVMC